VCFFFENKYFIKVFQRYKNDEPGHIFLFSRHRNDGESRILGGGARRGSDACSWQQGPKSSVRSKEQARKRNAARKLKRALNAKTLGGNVALEAKPLGEPELKLQQPLFPDLWW
jgi:hypothetical protein